MDTCHLRMLELVPEQRSIVVGVVAIAAEVAAIAVLVLHSIVVGAVAIAVVGLAGSSIGSIAEVLVLEPGIAHSNGCWLGLGCEGQRYHRLGSSGTCLGQRQLDI